MWFGNSTRVCRPVMSAPNLMRVGTAENIFVEWQDYSGSTVEVTIRVKTHPVPTREYNSTTVELNPSNHFQAMGQLTVIMDLFTKDTQHLVTWREVTLFRPVMK